MPDLTTPWCHIPRTVHTNIWVDHGGFPLWRLYTCHADLVANWEHVILLENDHLPRSDDTNFRTCAAFNCCCFRIYRLFSKLRLWSYVRWQHLQHCGRLSGICIEVGSQWVVYWMKSPLFCLIPIRSHLAEVSVETWCAGVEVKRWW